MAEFKLDRFKYRWRGDWSEDTTYRRDDIIRVNGKSYVCVIGHVSSPAFRTDLDAILPGSVPPQPQPKWILMTNGFSFVGDWTTDIDYNLGDIVKYNGSLWLCTINHNSASFADDFNNWTAFSQTTSFVGSWTNSTDYAPGAVVTYNGNAYKCIAAHTSSSTLENNADDWEIYREGVAWQSEYTSGTEYRVNDLVKYGGTVFRCIETHTAGAVLDDTKFTVEFFGSEFEGLWVNSTNYNIGDIVNHQGFIYYAVNNNTNSKPYVDGGNEDWILLARNTKFLGDWSVDSSYKTGDVVLRGGNLYLALRDIGPNYATDGSTLDYLEDDIWELIVPGISWKGVWTQGITYSVGSIVLFKGTAYTCNLEHTASFTNYPGDNGNSFEYWDVLIQAGQPAALEQKGDILTFGSNRLVSDGIDTVFDDSSLGDARLPIGETEQLLSVNEELEAFWRDLQEDADSVFVATNGIDDEDRGTFEKPFRTIRYAAEYVEDNFTPLKPVIIRASTGKFEEVSPIVVPAGCSVNGDELRSTRVFANSAKEEYQNLYPFVDQYIDYWITILLDVITGNLITPQSTTTEQQVTQFFINDDDGVPTDIFPTSNLDGANSVLALFNDYKNLIEFNILDGAISPVTTGSNLENTNLAVAGAGDALYYNRNFLADELLQYLKNNNPSVTFDEMIIKNEIRHLIRAIRRDTKYSGNYATLLSARKFANSVLGSATSDLFYMRDTTGLRDCTTGGLRGTLNPPGVFDLYQKPTGGALVSLDPGWGPEDERTWIVNRSPYIQGVTNTGFGCVGMKVDGALHEGGNKSMTANDFTQVLSDGIGALITNNARAELVSVFTYYCQIGYFAEDGGIIRAANGNNSYGRYGSIADGIDDTETPQVAAAFNRNNQAQVVEAFAGGSTDEIKIFEYSNAGQNYTTADANIVGAGADADVEYTDFRDGGIFELRLLSPDGSSAPNGADYSRKQGNAQETPDASSTLTLAASDTTQFLSEIDGLRVTITSGTGIGQYGYITGFTFSNKEITVARDSDNQPGWDHIIPGTPLVTSFDLTTRYRIEPKITVSPPPYATSTGDLFTNRTYVDMEFGTITESYTGVTAGGNVIWRDDVPQRVRVDEIVSPTNVKFSGVFLNNPTVPFTIKGRDSETEANVIAITANTGTLLDTEISGNGNSFVVGEEIDLLLAAGTGNTFDGAASAATFNIERKGTQYNVTLVNGGSGYSVNDKITILGTAVGGTTPANDLILTITNVSDDSTASILTFTQSGVGRGGRFVSLTSIENARYSDDGINWTEVQLPFASNMTDLIAGNDKFIALSDPQDSTNLFKAATTLDGIVWTEIDLPASANWKNGVYGNGKFVIVANDTDTVASSTDGVSWVTSTFPDDTDGGVDSTTSAWENITYGKGKYVAVSSSDGATATSSDGITWTRHDSAIPFNANQIAYGNNMYVAVSKSNCEIAYSFDGISWTAGENLSDIVGSIYTLSQIKFDNGIFFIIGTIEDGSPTLTAFTSEDGVTWTERNMPTSQSWSAITYGNGSWYAKANAATTNALASINVGVQAKFRASVDVGTIDEIRTIDPGSGYDLLNLPTVTVVDPNNSVDIVPEVRIGNGVLPQPDFINRGAGYRNTSSVITITGNGFADIVPVGNTLTISGVTNIPGPGVQITIQGIEDPLAIEPGTLFNFSGVTVEDLGDDGLGNETNLVRFQISPRLDVEYVVNHGAEITLRERFSQCRISGHDFLDIGTGNFEDTNYPSLYSDGAFFTASPENEVFETNNGRVFYVSTDQDGNFRTGELFSVQQATGIVTISAEFFDLDGLSELALGGVRLGGSGTVVNEFSTDPTFAADSNNVIPTQRAIATFLADRLSVGGENLQTNKLQAGRVLLGGFIENEMNTVGGYLQIPADVVIDGTFESDDGEGNITTNQTDISGTIVSQMLYFKGFDDSMQ